MSHTEINVAIAKALGIDPENGLVAFTVDVEKDRYPLVATTRRHRGEVDGDAVTDLSYKLVPVEDSTE